MQILSGITHLFSRPQQSPKNNFLKILGILQSHMTKPTSCSDLGVKCCFFLKGEPGSSGEIAGPRCGAKKGNIESETSFCVRDPESGPSEKITEASLKGLPPGKLGKI